MNCPDCNHNHTRVLDTETNGDGDAVRRRHECQRCSFRFTTYERPEGYSLQVKTRNGSIEPYDQQKLRGGILRSVEKYHVTDTKATELVGRIEADLQARDERIVASSLIGDLVSESVIKSRTFDLSPCTRRSRNPRSPSANSTQSWTQK